MDPPESLFIFDFDELELSIKTVTPQITFTDIDCRRALRKAIRVFDVGVGTTVFVMAIKTRLIDVNQFNQSEISLTSCVHRNRKD